MGGFMGAVRGGLAGLNEAAGNPGVASELEAANDRAREQKQADLKAKILPHGLAIQGLRQKLQTIDPEKNPNEYSATVDEIQKNVHAMREILHPDVKLGAGDWLKTHTTDRLHITNHDKRVREAAAKNEAGAHQDEETAQAIAKGQTPYYQTPEFLAKQAEEQQRIEGQIKVAEARLSAGGWTKNGNPVQVEGRWMQPFVNKMGETMMQPMPEGYAGPNTKPIKGTLVRSKQSPTGFAQTWVDPMNPNKVVAWQPITPSRYYEGTTTSSTTTDPFGVTSTSTRTTNPLNGGMVDLSGAQQMPAETDASGPTENPNAPGANMDAGRPQVGPKTKQLQQVRAHTQRATAAPKQLDENGSIPPTAGNPMLVAAANELLGGKSQKDLQMPVKDKQAAVSLAEQYGYLGEGMFTPRERMQVEQSQELIDSLRNDAQKMAIFDGNRLEKSTVAYLINAPDAKTFESAITNGLIAGTLSDADVDFVSDMRNLIGRIQGLAQLTRGSGRPTEAAVNRMIKEIPSLITAKNQQSAQHSFDLIQNEIDIGMGKGKRTPSAGGSKTEKLKQTQQSGSVSDDDIIKALSGAK